MADSIQNTLAARLEAIDYGAVPVPFTSTDRVVEHLNWDYSAGAPPLVSFWPDALSAVVSHAAFVKGRLNVARFYRQRQEDNTAQAEALPASDPTRQGFLDTAEIYRKLAKKVYGQLLTAVNTAELLDFFPAISG